MTIYAAKEFARGQGFTGDWGCYAQRSDLVETCLERGFEAGVEHFRAAMKAQIEKMFANDLVLRLGKTEILNYLDIEFETKTSASKPKPE